MKKVEYTCDGPSCEQTTRSIDAYSRWWTVVTRSPVTPFYNTTSGLVTEPHTFHFCSEACARDWLA